MKFTTTVALVLAAGTVAATGAQAKQGDVLVRVRAINVMPQEKSGPILPGTTTSPDISANKVSVNNTVTPEVDFTYMVTDNIGLEVIAGTARHTVSGVGPAIGGAKLVETNVLPPTLTAQYHLAPEGAFRPYVGVGVNYSTFFNTKAQSDLVGVAGPTKVKMKDSFGWAAQVGFDIPVNDKFFVNFDAKYIDIRTTATLTTRDLGVQKVKVDLNPIVLGVGIGTKF